MDLREPIATETVPQLLARLTTDARDLAQAEIALAKAKAGDAVSRYTRAIAFFAAAGVLALAALIALLVGLILSLATLVGPGFATLIVVVAVLAIAGVLAMIGRARMAPRKAAP